jgi:hypothetical protein
MIFLNHQSFFNIYNLAKLTSKRVFEKSVLELQEVLQVVIAIAEILTLS